MYAINLYFSDGDFLSNRQLLSEIRELPPREQHNGYNYQNRLDLLSHDAYGTVELWWLVGIYNNIISPMDFEINTLYTPALDDVNVLLEKYRDV